MATRSIGTGALYSTITAWEASLGVLSEAEIGQCWGEEFTESPAFSGATTTAANYVELTSLSTARHIGKAEVVYGTDHARITCSSGVDLELQYMRLSWLEIKSTGSTASDARVRVRNIAAGGSDIRIHHNVLHNDQGSSNASNRGVQVTDGDAVIAVYRNIAYGYGGAGIYVNNCASGSVVYHNTVFECNYSNTAGQGGFEINDSDCTCKYNIAFANDQADFVESAGTFDFNVSSDTSASGDGSHNSQTASEYFVNATTTWADCDLTLKAFSGSGVDVIEDGGEVLSSPTDIDVDIQGATLVDRWDLGASGYGTGTVLQRRTLYSSLGSWADAGFAAGTVAEVYTYSTLTHAANQGYEYRVIRQNSKRERSEFTSDSTKIHFNALAAKESALPNRPLHVHAKPIAGGKMLVTWLYDSSGQAVAPTDFRVFRGTTASGIDFNTPLTDSVTGLTNIPYVPGQRRYSFTTAAFSTGTDHSFAVRSRNAAGTAEKNTHGTPVKASDQTAKSGAGGIVITK